MSFWGTVKIQTITGVREGSLRHGHINHMKVGKERSCRRNKLNVFWPQTEVTGRETECQSGKGRSLY
jgi:hypothetical protein